MATFDTTLLCMTLTERKMLDHVGGLNYVGKLIDYAPTTSNVGIYADMVKRRGENDATSSPSAPA